MKRYQFDYDKPVDCVQITSKFSDFDGSAEEWRKAFFDLLSWKNTWGVPYVLDIESNRDHEAFLCIVTKKCQKEQTIEYLAYLGYRNITCNDTKVLEVECWDDDFDWIVQA